MDQRDVGGPTQRASIKDARSQLAARLSARRPEIENALVTRVDAISSTAEVADPEYAEGLRMALQAALGWALAAIETGERRAPLIPTILFSQARLAARASIGLDTVLRRYFAGYSLLNDFIFQEAETAGLLETPTLQRLFRSQAILFDQLVAAVSEEYARETRSRLSSTEHRDLLLVRRLLAGELVDVSELNYEFEANHVALVIEGRDARAVLRGFAATLGKRLLAVRPDERIAWGWLGSRSGIPSTDLDHVCGENKARGAVIAVGEPAEGLDGWRLTHHQACAAIRFARLDRGGPIRYSDIALEASLSRDELLSASLRHLYLNPLERTRNSGKQLRDTLATYFACGRNISSTAVSLNVDRRTVSNRLRTAEGLLGRPLEAIAPQLELALRLHELDESA